MNPQGDRHPPQFRKGRAARRMILLMTGTLVALSCTRVPTALRSKITVVGRVTVSPSKPLPGTTLFFTGEPALKNHAYAIADSSGAYSVRLISGTYDVEIDPPIGLGLLAHTEQVTVSDNHARVDFTFGGYRVTGRVVAPNGTLVDSGRVAATLLSAPGHSQAMSLLKQGSYSLLLPAGGYSFHAGAANHWSGFYPGRQESVLIDADTTIDFWLDGISVSGKVLGPDGLPMKDVGVEARAARHSVQNRTATDGNYQLYIPSGSYRLWFRPPHPFFIMPRVVGPMTITEPTSIDGDLSGIEWAGTIRRIGTNEPVPGITVLVKMIEGDDQGAAILTGPQGDFRFILEADRRYDLSTHDPERRETVARVHGVTATTDTTLEILIAPQTTATRADSTIRLSIRSVAGKTVHRTKKRSPPDWIEVTLHNTDRDTVTLVLPGDGSYWGWRTPLMDWEVRAPGGPRLERTPVALCGNINPLHADQVFRLPPGAQRKFTTAVPEYYPYEKSHSYEFRLSYENRPHLAWGGLPLGAHDPNALRLLRQSTPCKLLSNALELKVK